MTARTCQWCQGPIPERARSDARYCATRCRQAAHRFHRHLVVRERAQLPHRFAYADPPYPGLARRYYAGHPDYAGEVDHLELLLELEAGGFDGWALSTSAAALPQVLALCVELELEVRVAAWVRGERPVPHDSPLSAWEPVLVRGGRQYRRPADDRRTDALVAAAKARTTDPARVVGAKPGAFCAWLFDLLGALPGDELVDVFPGSGGVARAWAEVSRLARADASDDNPPEQLQLGA